jgi:putative inorganic carbon (hco3(-)) transporter
VGTGLGHYIPFIAYLGFWIMSIRALTGRPDLGLYYSIPFLPYRALRDHLLEYPLGGNMLTILLLATVAGALMQGKRLPKSYMFGIWGVFGAYLYVSMWLGTALGNAPAPLWLNDVNFVTWKDYMLIPLVFTATAMLVEDRRAVRRIIMVAAFTVFFIDRSSLMDSLSRSWGKFDESKRDGGPLGLGSNEMAAFLAQFSMFFWGFGQFMKKKWKLVAYGLTGLTLMATMYCFSRAAYMAIIVCVFVLGLVKDRKLLVLGVVFLIFWTALVPKAVVQRIDMTENSYGQLESSAQERVNLWENAKTIILSDPIFGMGYATYQMTSHVDGLRDTHNWYVKVMVETGIIGMFFAVALILLMFSSSWRLFRTATDPLYRGLGLGLLLATTSCVVANCFGDRWTYLEVNGLLWVLFGAATRALELRSEVQPAAAEPEPDDAPLYLQAHFR